MGLAYLKLLRLILPFILEIIFGKEDVKKLAMKNKVATTAIIAFVVASTVALLFYKEISLIQREARTVKMNFDVTRKQLDELIAMGINIEYVEGLREQIRIQNSAIADLLEDANNCSVKPAERPPPRPPSRPRQDPNRDVIDHLKNLW